MTRVCPKTVCVCKKNTHTVCAVQKNKREISKLRFVCITVDFYFQCLYVPVGKEIQIYDRGSWNKVDSITVESDTEVSLNSATDIVGFYDNSKIITVLLHKIK